MPFTRTITSRPSSPAVLFAWMPQPWPPLEQVQKRDVKWRATTSTPCSIMSLVASVLSRPPDNKEIALLFIIRPGDDKEALLHPALPLPLPTRRRYSRRSLG